jgi:hypothetical protein
MLAFSGCTRKFTVIPQLNSLDFSVGKPYGAAAYVSMVDARDAIDKTGKQESICTGGKAGVMHLGDKNYRDTLIAEFDSTMKRSIINSRLFSPVADAKQASDSGYSFVSTLDKFHVTLDEGKAQQTQACIGGIIGAAIASSIDVTATTDVLVTGKLIKDKKEIWLHSISKQIIQRDIYAKTEKNAENSMGIAIGESCKELITEMAKFLSTQPMQ